MFSRFIKVKKLMPNSSLISSLLPKVLRGAGTVAKYIVVIHLTSEYIFNILVTTGPSMEPTIQENDVIVSNVFSAKFGELSINDIIIARSPTSPSNLICKRITALAGDIKSMGDKVVVIPRGHIWVEGDNGNNSNDSRVYGPIPAGLVKGKAILRIWPPRRISLFASKTC